MDAVETQHDESRTSGWRGSREGWLEAAKAALIEGGIDAVKIQPLAQRLALSRTSFYWFFRDRSELLDALLDDWERTNTTALIDGCNAYADTLAEAVLNVTAAFVDERRFQPRLDFAIRGWAHNHAPIATVVAEADDRRLAAIRAVFLRFGMPEDEADVRARAVYMVQIGYISMQVQESLETRMLRIPAYVKTFAGIAPTEREMARFRALFEEPPTARTVQ